MADRNLKRRLLIRGDESHRYHEIDVSNWEPGGNFIGLPTGEDFPEGEEWFLYYPWQGETKIDHRYENGRLWVNGRVAGVDFLKVKLDDLENKTTIVTVKALPTQLNQVQKLPNLLVLEVLKEEGDLLPLAELRALTKLTVWPQVDDVLLSYLANMENLRELHLYGSQRVNKITDAGLKLVAGLSKLKELVIGGTCPEVTDTGLSHLKDLENLRALELHRTAVTDSGLSYLKGFKNLTRLSLSGAKITDAGLEFLKGFTKLKDLSLMNTGVTDAGIDHLLTLKNLKYLFLKGTKVTEEGITRLKKALPNCMFY